jgi:hypothetical protein
MNLTSLWLRCVIGAGLIAASPLAAQPTTQSLAIGGAGARGCQDLRDPPRLSDGTLAAAVLDFTYDAPTRVLDLVVTNTSPVIRGVPNPLITRIAFNLPHQAVTAVTLLSQTGVGGAAPDFELAADTDVFQPPDLRVACTGHVGVLLDVERSATIIRGGIGNVLADTYAAPPGSVVIGPVTFRMRLAGPGTASLSAQAIAMGFTRFASQHQVNALCKFQGGGPQGDGSGFLTSTVANAGCRPSGWLATAPRIGTRLTICLNGEPACGGCFIGSFLPGPVVIGPFRIPIGLPLAFDVFIPPLARNTATCFTLDIPPDQSLVGRTLYIAVATPGTVTDDLVDFSPRINVTFIE